MNIKNITVGSILSTLVAAVPIWYLMDPWPKVGWTTPNTHNADFAEAVGEMKEFRDEWKCDEDEEELIDLLKQQRAGDNSVETAREIEKIRNRMEKLKCSRFDDD